MGRTSLKLVFFCLLAVLLSCTQGGEGNGKKVYADYHGVRYTREHDGKLGRWEMYADTPQSSTGRKTLCYNADLIDSQGRHDIAATAYPLCGMQSNLDPELLEYQILQAKTAGIDGFFIEWGFFPHENDLLLKSMQKAAAKYDFEVGDNWCDGWLYYNWITKIYPEIDSREAKTDYMVKCYQYLIDSVLSVSTAPVVDGYPVFYHFGPGATIEEWSKVRSSVILPEAMSEPVALRRWADWGRLEDGRYVAVKRSDDMDAWIEAGEVPTPWIPARVRTQDEQHPYWDNYAETEDLIAFMEPFRDSVWASDMASYKIKSGFVMPGMDNRGCAGWGRGHFFLIPRNEGLTYRTMWDFCMESADSLDMIFIASWSDYTEGHEIEPTVENGYRELLSTLEYASRFKDIPRIDQSGIELPLKLFKSRKQCRFLKLCGADVSSLTNDLDNAALLISKGRYKRASRLLEGCHDELESLVSRVETRTVSLQGCEKKIFLEDSLTEELQSHNFDCTLEFQYLDSGRNFLFVRSSRNSSDGTEVLGKLRADDSGEWKTARMLPPAALFDFSPGKPAISFSDGVEVRSIKLTFNIYSLK